MDIVQFCTTLHPDGRQFLGRRVLKALAKNAQANLDELITVAAFFGLQATEVADVIAARASLLNMSQVA